MVRLTPAGAHGQPVFIERRRGSIVFWCLAFAIPLVGGYPILSQIREGIGNPLGFTLAVVLVAGFHAGFMFLMLGPIGGEFKHLRVDEQGVWVRSKLLPANEIGEAQLLSEGEAASSTISSRIEGMWLLRGRATYSHVSSHGRAVYVRRHLPDGTIRPWLLATHRPDELIAAIDQVRTRDHVLPDRPPWSQPHDGIDP